MQVILILSRLIGCGVLISTLTVVLSYGADETKGLLAAGSGQVDGLVAIDSTTVKRRSAAHCTVYKQSVKRGGTGEFILSNGTNMTGLVETNPVLVYPDTSQASFDRLCPTLLGMGSRPREATRVERLEILEKIAQGKATFGGLHWSNAYIRDALFPEVNFKSWSIMVDLNLQLAQSFTAVTRCRIERNKLAGWSALRYPQAFIKAQKDLKQAEEKFEKLLQDAKTKP